MFKNLSGAKLGIFIFIGSVLLVIGIFVLGNKEALFQSTFTIKTYFQNISGLRDGAPVRLSGVDVGAVSGIKIMGETSSKIEVSMRILTDVARFIRNDTEAGIETEGLVGYKFIALYIKGSNADFVEEGGTILAKDPVSFADVIEETQGIMAYTKEMTKNLSEVIAKINRGEGTLGKVLTDDDLYYASIEITRSASVSLDSITHDLRNVVGIFKKLGVGLDGTMIKVDNAVTNIDSLITNIKAGKGILGALIEGESSADSSFGEILYNLKGITEDTKLATIKLNENMEALKHNWLFKSYFEERGYWDAAEYQKDIDEKTEELNKKIELLDKKIDELKSLEEKR